MAKSGQIQLDGISVGTEPLADAVVFTESTPTSLGNVVTDLLEKSSDAIKVMVDPVSRKVTAFPIATDVVALLTGGSKKCMGLITRDDPTKRSSPVTRADSDDISGDGVMVAINAALDTAFGAQKPSKNVASIVNALEDAVAAQLKLDPSVADYQFVAIVDQTGDGNVKIYSGMTTIAQTGAVAKVKQVQQADSTVTPLAFE